MYKIPICSHRLHYICVFAIKPSAMCISISHLKLTNEFETKVERNVELEI